MSTWDEKAAKAAVESRHAIYDEDFWGYSDQSDAQDDGFENGARWQRGALLADDVIERAARALYAEDVNESMDTPWPDYDSPKNVGRPLYEERARNALLAAIGDNDE